MKMKVRRLQLKNATVTANMCFYAKSLNTSLKPVHFNSIQPWFPNSFPLYVKTFFFPITSKIFLHTVHIVRFVPRHFVVSQLT